MIIKRWNGTSFVKEFPQTKAQLIRNGSDTENVFDENDKIIPKFLPDSVFDSLKFQGVVSPSSLSDILYYLWDDVALWGQTDLTTVKSVIVGKYWVVSSGGAFTSSPTVTQSTEINQGDILLNRTVIRPSDGGAEGNDTTTTSTTAEIGDWFVITNVSGNGTSGNPWYVTFSFINNAYELATTSIDGIVRLSSRSTYAALAGNNVITEERLKVVIDNASFALSGHVHGNIGNGGVITSTVVTPADTDTILIGDASNSGKIERGITIGTSTTTYLTNAGTWATPTGTYVHPSYTSRSIDTSGVDVLDTFTSDSSGHVTAITTRTLPNATTSSAGVMSSTDKTKLDGIETGANLYVHPTYTYSTPSADTQTTLSNIQLISTLTQTNGHVTGGTARKLVAGTNVSISAAADGNITISSTDTNTTYSAKALGGLTLDGTAFQMNHPLFIQTATPSTPLSGTIWFDTNP